MTPERWQQIKAVLADALDLPPGERAEFLDRVCAGDEELRREVEKLIEADGLDSVLAVPVKLPPDPQGLASASVDHESLECAALNKLFAGKYDVIRLLGRGGMGSVWLASDLGLDLRVAIKVLRPELANTPEIRARFKREARTVAGFKHPNIVQLNGYGEIDGVCFFVMRYVPGGSLADRLRIEGTIPPDEARKILEQLADALHYAHSHAVIHRDIKPANILFDADHRPMLADFGIAKVGGVDTLTPIDQRHGTPFYMSPEQDRGHPNVDARTDQYSLGLVAYEMLAGRHATATRAMADRFDQVPVPVQDVARDVSPALATIVTRCLERNRSLRYPDARALTEALQHAGTEPGVVPENVRREILGFGQYAFVWASLWTIYALRGNHDVREMVLTLIIAFLVPVGFALNVWNLGRHGLPKGELVLLSWWPPEWWGMWWPAVLRRPADLWGRLPWQARGMRAILSLFFVGMPALVMAQSALPTPSSRLAAAEYALLLGTALATGAGIVWARRQGLTFSEATRVLFGATMPTSAWNAPRVSRLLAPIRGVRPPQADDPRDYRRAIHELVRLWSKDAPPTAVDATKLGDRLLLVIARLEEQIALLDRDASPAEVERLAALVAEYEGRSGDIWADLAEVKRQDLEVRRRMRRESESATDERQILLDLMKELWTQLCRSHAHSLDGSIATADAPIALRSVGERVAMRIEATPYQPGYSSPTAIPTPSPVS